MEMVIVCVHGRGQDWEVKDTLLRTWRDALRFGIERSGTVPLTLSNDQIILAHYGDLFRPNGYVISKGIRQTEDNNAFEEGLAELFIREAQLRNQIDLDSLEQAREDIEGRIEKGLINTAKPALRLLDKLPGFSDFVLPLIVQDVDRYLHNYDFRYAVIERVVSVLQRFQNREIIVVAHSLGTVVAYDAINTHPEIPISSFLTLGSPLGIQTYIYQKLLVDNQQLRSFPTAIIGNWSNYYDIDDIVALTPDLTPFFSRVDKPDIINIQVVNRTTNHHSSDDYLSSKAVGRMIRSIFDAS